MGCGHQAEMLTWLENTAQLTHNTVDKKTEKKDETHGSRRHDARRAWRWAERPALENTITTTIALLVLNKVASMKVWYNVK